jgi:Glyoxalase/Bleomycin resistance protein/Dioxygenase superfamily
VSGAAPRREAAISQALLARSKAMVDFARAPSITGRNRIFRLRRRCWVPSGALAWKRCIIWGGEAGGLRLEAEASAAGPLVILYSSDLEATMTRVREAGGRMTMEPFEFPGGRRFHFADPSGNELAVWSDR